MTPRVARVVDLCNGSSLRVAAGQPMQTLDGKKYSVCIVCGMHVELYSIEIERGGTIWCYANHMKESAGGADRLPQLELEFDKKEVDQDGH